MAETPEGFQPQTMHVTTEMVIVVLSIMLTITLVLVAYVKCCRVNPSDRDNVPGLAGLGSTFSGVDKQVIEALPVFKFSSLRGSKEGLECVVCLSKFEDSETLRLLPKCKHAFHVNCIDKWLERHSSCPLCRSSVDPGDVRSFNFSISSSFLRVPSNLTDDPNVEIFVQRDQSRHGSLRFNAASKRDELLIDNGGNWEILHKFNHRIVVSGFVTRSRWSDLNSADLLSLNSEMLSVMSSRRFSPTECTKGSSNLPSTSKEEETSLKLLNPGERRSVSEIANVPRFAGINRVKKLVSSHENNGREARVWRMWLPIARRTVQGFARRERSSRESEHKQLASVV